MATTSLSSHRPPRRLHSLRAYLIAMNLLLLCLLFPSVSAFLWHTMTERRDAELDNRILSLRSSVATQGGTLLHSMALSAGQAVSSFDYSFLNSLIQQVVASDSRLGYCLLMDSRGVVVASSDAAAVGTTPRGEYDQRALALLANSFPPTSAVDAVIPAETITSEIDVTKNRLMEIASPVYGGGTLWGVVRCAYSLQELQQQIETTREQWQTENRHFLGFFITMALFAMLVGVMISLYFTRRLVLAVTTLDRGVKAVAQGDLGQHVPPDALLCTEFDSLAESFNRMTTNLRQSRQQLNEYNKNLEQQVAERTRQLDVTNKELEAFSYSVSHDLRAPLRRIDGFSEMLLEDYQDKLDEQGKDYLRRVRHSARRMSTLIDDLLALSRVSRSTLTRQMVDITALANATLALLREREPERTVETHVETDLHADADPRLVAIVFDNLLGNAWKYTSKTSPASIAVGSQEREGARVFYVKDNGAGFDMRNTSKLFGAFQRLHSDDDFPGTGIGLATVKRIITRHGGQIWAEAEIGKGATFFFTLHSAPVDARASSGSEGA